MQHDALQCRVHSVYYDFDAHAGALKMQAGDCCDMTACIALFQRIDPAVENIMTFSGMVPDTVYKRLNGTEWQAYLPLPEPVDGKQE